MTRIFISYSRVDIEIVENRIYPLLARKYQHENVWYDDQIHGGDDWWQTILGSIAYADIFVYVLSNESVSSEYCQAEFHEAQRLQKFIITVQVRDRTKLDGALSAIQYIDMKPTADQADAVTRLFTAIDRQDVRQIRQRKPLTKIITQQPRSIADIESVSEHEVDTLTLQAIVIPSREKQGFGLNTGVQIFGLLVGLIFTIVGVWSLITNFPGGGSNPSATPSTEIVQGADDTSTPIIEPSPEPSQTPSETATPTNPPNATEIEQTIVAEMNAIILAEQVTQDAIDLRATAVARSTLNAQATVDAQVTLDTQATLDAQAMQTQAILNVTATAYAPIQLAIDGVDSNNEWAESIVEYFNGVPMSLVPAGCFWVGDDNGNESVQPSHLRCFDQPFWIDQYEVSNTQFEGFDGIAEESGNWNSDFLPRENISWFEAREFCLSRDARLPTELEWEYAARGVNGLTYPWGNRFLTGFVVYAETGNDRPDPFNSKEFGVSWVGAFHMTGNVIEWTNSRLMPYPYDPDDGREAFTVENSLIETRRVTRGGGWNSTSSNLESANRTGFSPDYRGIALGLRCARDFNIEEHQ